ncbi:ATP-grasp domain-containing protein [Mycobacterium sp. TY814]|uniref:ATP-grasp domain-containing protein n=1 Tax=unclassified Mycobacterium TaxID=2642494 RepID=UPI00274205D0|nr:ATP-grasp domain-containing protein [Mycobacterium sp. TY814]MDP7720890.1 ATP-grasp domain-containing protein [Mycobacterium sp. TY814]
MAKYPTLLVLGASNYQCSVIQRAKERGVRVVVVDWSAENPGHTLAEEAHVASTTDITTVLRIARRSNINGIIAPATDVGVVTQAVVAEQLGLSGPPPQAARLLTSKSAFFDYLLKLHYPVPPFETFVSNPPSGAPTAVSLPCIVKPDDSSGSKGVTLVSHRASFASAIAAALEHSRSGIALAQHYEAGFQGTVEGCLLDGEIIFSCVTQRHLPAPPVVATAGHSVPSGLAPAQIEQVLKDVRNILTSLSIFNSVFDADFVWSGEAPIFLELTPRLGGNSLSQLIRFHYGISIEDMAIDLALTGTTSVVDRPPYVGASKVELLHSEEGGRLEYDPARLRTALAISGIKRIVLDHDPGKMVVPFMNGRHRFGEIVVQGPTRQAADLAIDEARAALLLRIV